MHRRLSIIDVANSSQPMSTPDGRFHVTFNGEILNYRELREQVDYPFETDGDTEVVLAMFARFGVDGVKRLRGQFAFAIHDSKLDELWLVRDRLGILPLFYFKSSDVLAFGSEIKALLPVLPGGARVARQSLHGYLRQRAVPAPDTLVEGVVKLRPAEVICFKPTGGKIAARYWLPPGPADRWEGNVSTAVDMVERALKEAVTDALVSDVPVGAYLSGGVDSSLIVALASHQVSQPMHTFCASFGDPRLDESRHADSVAQLFGTRHHQIPMVPSTFLELWPRLSWHRDAPISEPSDIAVFRLAEAAREHVKVVLSGEGSDELFGGYPKYRFARLSFAAGLVPTALRQLALSMAEQTLPPASNRARIAMRALAADSPSDRARSWFSPFTGPEAARILGMPGHPEGHTLRGRDPVDLMCRVDIDSWLPDNLLERGDRMSMAASLELRPPFLDHRLVELALRLPSSFKVRSGETKWIVKQVADRHLPSTITRRRKVGFKVPLDAWLRTELRDVTRDLLLSEESQLSGVVDRQEVQRLLTLHDTGRRNEEIRIWTLLSLEQWLRTLPSMTSGECAGSQG
jgi:asparagine synthase (glutamine-hydrolysing)